MELRETDTLLAKLKQCQLDMLLGKAESIASKIREFGEAPFVKQWVEKMDGGEVDSWADVVEAAEVANRKMKLLFR